MVLVGTPGCGKTTFCEAVDGMLAGNLTVPVAVPSGMPRPVRVCQDDLGDRRTCESLVEAAFAAGYNVIVDRCNWDRAQRANWLKIAQGVGATAVAVFMDTPVAACKQRVMKREVHPTLGPTQASMRVIERCAEMLCAPVEEEGFSQVVTASGAIVHA